MSGSHPETLADSSSVCPTAQEKPSGSCRQRPDHDDDDMRRGAKGAKAAGMDMCPLTGPMWVNCRKRQRALSQRLTN